MELSLKIIAILSVASLTSGYAVEKSENLHAVLGKLYQKIKILQLLPGKNLSLFLDDLNTANRDCVCSKLHIDNCDTVSEIKIDDVMFEGALTWNSEFFFYEYNSINENYHKAIAVAATICKEDVDMVVNMRLERMKADYKDDEIARNLKCFEMKIESYEAILENCDKTFEYFEEKYRKLKENHLIHYLATFYPELKIRTIPFVIIKLISRSLIDYKIAHVANSNVSEEIWIEMKKNLLVEVKNYAQMVIDGLIGAF